MFLEEDRFCIKACRPSDGNAPSDCNHIYDVMDSLCDARHRLTRPGLRVERPRKYARAIRPAR